MPGSSVRGAGITAVELRHSHQHAGPARSLALGDLMLGTSDWIYSLALVILAYRLTGSLAWVAGVLLVQATGRLVVIGFCSWFGGCARDPYATVVGLVRPVLIASLVLVSSDDALWWAVVVAGLMGASGAIHDAARTVALPPPPAPGDASLTAKLLARSDQISMILGSLVAGLLIVIWNENVAFITAAAAGAAAALIFPTPTRGMVPRPATPNGRAGEPAWKAVWARPAFRRVVIALATGAALGIGLRVMLVDVVLSQHDSTELVYGLMIAFAGVGTLYTPVSIPRLLGKLGPELVLAGMIVALAGALVFIHIARPLAIVIPVIFACGILAMSADRVAETLTRRLVPDGDLDEALRLLAAAAVAGQALALAAFLAIEPSMDSLVVGLALAGAGIIFAAMMLRGQVTTSLYRLRGGDIDERQPAQR